MKFTLERNIRETIDYEVEVDEKFCGDLEKWLKANVLNPDEVPHITPEVVFECETAGIDYEGELNVMLKIKPHGGEVCFVDFVAEWLIDTALEEGGMLLVDEWTDSQYTCWEE